MAAIDQSLAELAANVQRAAAGQYPDHQLVELTVLPGGHSGLTHVATLAADDDKLRVVVKSAPPGRPPRGRHDVLRQARILRALNAWGRISVPEVLFWAEE